jgi:hypothetical protein
MPLTIKEFHEKPCSKIRISLQVVKNSYRQFPYFVTDFDNTLQERSAKVAVMQAFHEMLRSESRAS